MDTLDDSSTPLPTEGQKLAWNSLLIVNMVSLCASLYADFLCWGATGWGQVGMLFMILPGLLITQLLLSGLPTLIVISKLGSRFPEKETKLRRVLMALGCAGTIAGAGIALLTGSSSGC